MSLESLFYYRRVVMQEGKPVITDIWDCISVFSIKKGWWSTPDFFSVFLDDGHEETKEKATFVGKNGKQEVRKEVGWYLTQIDMCKEDGERLRRATELYPPGKYYLDNVNVGNLQVAPEDVP